MKKINYLQRVHLTTNRSDAGMGGKCSSLTWLVCVGMLLVLLANTAYGADGSTPNNIVISSPNPKTNPLFSKKDLVQVNMKDVFRITKDLIFGLKGTIQYGANETVHDGAITLKVWPYSPNKSTGKIDTCLYEIKINATSTANFMKVTRPINIESELVAGKMLTVQSDEIGRIATSSQIYTGECSRFKPWYSNISSWLSNAFSLIVGPPSEGYFDDCAIHTSPYIYVIVEVTYSGNGTKTFTRANVPGIGDLELQTKSGSTIVNIPYPNIDTYCSGNATEYCNIYRDILNPSNPTAAGFKENIYVASHRGKWGQPLSGGEPENTLEAVQAAEALTGFSAKMVEMDVTQIADGRLVFLHDYVMSRLTSYTGEKFSFEMSWSEMSKYKVRLRDGSESARKVTLYTDMLTHMRDNHHFLMLDIKENQAKMKGSLCKANCAFQSSESQDQSWTSIASKAIEVAGSLGASHNIMIKTYKSARSTLAFLGNKNSKSTFWTPMIVSNAPQWKTNGQADIQKMCDFVDEWQTELGDFILCYETDFFTPGDVQLQSFTRTKNGVATTYQNLPHYIYATTGRRSGIFSEDPASSKGTVNRWADWKMKDTTTDQRGDFIWLTTIPYGKIFLVTTDRPDVWNSLKSRLQQ
jgi:Glycerophosphoryl diester phosphodiesterase family